MDARFSARLWGAALPNLTSGDVSLVDSVLKFSFSWIGLMPAAIAVSGILLRHIPGCRLSHQEHHLIGIPLWPVYYIKATGDEVIFGIGLFITEFFLLGLTAGHQIYSIMRAGFGVNLGQFNSICAFSAFSSVILSFIVLMMFLGGHRIIQQHNVEAKQYVETMTSLAARESATTVAIDAHTPA
jgi:hypothetical protein